MVSVTKLIDLLDKPALLGWANKLGLKGVSLNDYSKNVKLEGTNKHNDIEEYLKNGVYFEGCEKLKYNLSEYEILGIEETIDNGKIIGRIDIVLKKNGLIYICDFKRNKRIYLKTKLQLSAYKEMLNADKICFINTESFEVKEIKIDTSKYYEIVKRLYQIYILINDLKERI